MLIGRNRNLVLVLMGLIALIPGVLAAQWWLPAGESDSTQSLSQGTSLGSGSLSLRTQHAIASWNDSPLVVLTDDKDVYVVEEDGTRHHVTTLKQGSSGPTIAASDDRVVVAWVTATAIVASSSADLVTWTEPITVGSRQELGGPIPSADWTGDQFVVVWVDAPKTNTATGGMDGVGALRVATGNGVDAWTMKTLNTTTAIVAVSGSTIVWRDDRSVSSSSSLLDSVRIANIDGSGETVICSGYDPAIFVDGSSIAIGYHLGSEAHLRTTTDGVTWSDVVTDTSGKFVSPFIAQNAFGATWIDYIDSAAANDARNNAGHRVTAVWDNEEYPMNDGASYTSQGQADVVDGVPVLVYSYDGNVYIVHGE